MADNPQQKIREEALKTAAVVKDAFEQISSNITDLFEQALGKTEGIGTKALKTVKKELTSLADISKSLSNANLKASEGLLKQKDITQEINRRKSQQFSLDTQLKILKDNILTLGEEELKLLQELETQKEELVKYDKEYTDELEKQLRYSENINKSVGATGTGLSVLSKLSSKIGLSGMGDAFEGAREAAVDMAKNLGVSEKKALGFGGKLKVAGAAGGSLLSSLGSFLKGPIWITALLKIAEFFKDAMFAASKQVAGLQRNLSISRDNAVEIRDRFFEISDNAKILAKTQTGNLILQKDLIEAQESFNTALGLAVDLSTKQNEEFAAQFTNIKKFYDLNEQEQKGLINLYTINGKTVNETRNNILGQVALFKINTKEAINIKKVYKEILTTSNATKLSIKGGTEALTQAVINAQKLGVTLDSLGKIADNLLNFEQSISAELEAELITGRDLNLERARAAALMNDQVTLTEEVNRLVKDAGPDFEKNRIAMQASANAIGISVEELADMVTQQKAVEKFKQSFQALDVKAIENSKILSEGEKKRLKEGKATAQDYYKFAKEQGKDLNVILGEEMATRLEAQDAQQKFNDALEKAKETFSRFVDGGALDKFADFLVRFVESVGIKGLGRTLIGGLASDIDIAKAKTERKQQEIDIETDPEKKKQLQSELNELTKNVTETIQKENTAYRAKVMRENPYGEEAELIRSAEEGRAPRIIGAKDFIIKTLPEDTVVGMGGTALGRTDEMVQLLTEQNRLLMGILNKEGSIILNGTKMGTAMAVGGYKVQ